MKKVRPAQGPDAGLRAQLIRGRSIVLALSVFALCFTNSSFQASAQQANNPGGCVGGEAGSFNFLIGKWRGEERASMAKDAASVSTSEVEIKQILGGCVLQEMWEVSANGKKLFSAILHRAFDVKSGKWMLSYIDDAQNFQVYEGRKDKEIWRFYRERIADGKPVQIRITWTPAENGFTQTVERSTDGGQTWSLGAVVTYTRRK